MLKKTNLLILGHTSFIGNHLTNYFKNKKQFNVKGFNSKTLNLTKNSNLKKLNPYINDSIVIILSANKTQKGAGLNVLKENFLMNFNLINYIKNKKVKKIIYVSSQVVFGENINNIKTIEKTKNIASSYYGLSKIIAENNLKITFQDNPKLFTIIRMPRIYGPSDSIKNYGPTKFASLALNNEIIKIWGSGKELREFIHVDDIVKIFNKIINLNIYGEINIASGNAYSFIDVISEIEKILRRKVKFVSQKRTGKLVNHVFDNTKFKKTFKNFKFIDLSKGIKDIISKRDFTK